MVTGNDFKIFAKGLLLAMAVSIYFIINSAIKYVIPAAA